MRVGAQVRNQVRHARDVVMSQTRPRVGAHSWACTYSWFESVWTRTWIDSGYKLWLYIGGCFKLRASSTGRTG